METRSSTVNVSIDLRLPSFNQTLASTWKDSGVTNVDAFIAAGCGVCAYASLNKSTIKTMITSKICRSNADPYLVKHPGTTANFTSGVRLKAIEQIVLNRKPSAIFVDAKSSRPTHFVAVTGFQGTLPTDSQGNPICLAATPDMVKIMDPYSGSCKTLADLEQTYGPYLSIRY